METVEKVQLVLNVIDGKAHPSVLKDFLGEPGDREVNFFKLAVDHVVGKVLQAQAGKPEQFRFKIVERDAEMFTDWVPERSQFSASMAMGQLRLQHPHAEILIERQH